mmetsp:Transcript_5565/g.9547  ORF Transcript_5565/g.9547 Transcript_5565/m.9547 type:complete len:82 (+) Transcript_5565:1298-1543(+)
MGLKYFEKSNPQQIERQLILLGLYNSSLGKSRDAEVLYRQAIEKMEREKNFCYTLMMAKNLYGRLLLRDPKRKQEGFDQIK